MKDLCWIFLVKSQLLLIGIELVVAELLPVFVWPRLIPRKTNTIRHDKTWEISEK